MPDLVNGQAQSLSTVNKDNSSNKSALKDSVKDAKAGIAQLIETLLKSGVDGNIGSTLAPVIGLPTAMPMKKKEVVLSQRGADEERRGCFIIYETAGGPDVKENAKRPVCAYIVRFKRSGSGRQTRYFRIDLNGKLVKVILSEGKHDASGKVVRGSGVKTDLDIDSPEVRRTFEAEMDFWLKDWLKKQQQNAPKKTAESSKPNSAATTL